MSLEPIADSVLSAFFGSFLGAALGKDVAALTVNLASSSLEGLGIKAIDHLRSRGNHDLEKLIVASFAKATQKTLKKVDESGMLQFWRNDQNEALSQLRNELAQVLAHGPEEESSQLIESILLGRPDRVEAALRSFMEPRLAVTLADWKCQEPEKWEELCTEVSRQFLPHFQELYKSEHHSAGRLALERDIAWATLQSLQDQGVILSQLTDLQASQLENIRNRLEEIANGQSSVPDWTPYFENVVSEIKGAASSINIRLDNLGESTEQLRIGIERLSLATQIKTISADIDDGQGPIPDHVAAELSRGNELDSECKYDEAIPAFELALRLAEEAGHKRAVIRAGLELGEVLTRNPYTLDRARVVLNKCLSELRESPDLKSRGIVLNLLGHVELFQGRIQEGKALCAEALNSIQALGDRGLATSFLLGAAHAAERTGNLPEAHRLLDEASSKLRIDYRESVGRDKIVATINLAGSLMMKAHVFEHEAMVDEMLSVLDEAESLSREAKHQDTLANTLVSRTNALFAKSMWEAGLTALDEATELFKSIGNIHGLLECHNMRARQAFQLGNRKLAFEVCVEAISIAEENGSPTDFVQVNGQMAELCRRNNLEKEAAVFHAEAKRVAKKHNLSDELVSLLLDEADELRGKNRREEDNDKGKLIVREALNLLEELLVKCEIKGRRAVYLNRIGSLYGRLKSLTEAKLRFEQSLRIFQEIGDTHGIADSLAYLAAIARERGETSEAIRLLESVLQVTKDKPLYYFHAGVHHDLVSLKMLRGDLQGARMHFNEASTICMNHPIPDVYEALQETQSRLEFLERSRNPAPSDLWRMVRELRQWVDRFPKDRDAILSFWYQFYGADVWSNLRAQYGVKFLVCSQTLKQFENFVTEWRHAGDTFVYAANANNESSGGVDVFPWGSDRVPPHLTIMGLRCPEGKTISPDEWGQAIRTALKEKPYFLTVGTDKETPDSKLYIYSRRYRVAKEISEFMLERNVDSIIDGKSIIIPIRESDEQKSLLHDLLVAWENHMVPVFFDSMQSDKEVSLVQAALFSKSVDLLADKTVYKSIHRVLRDCGKDHDSALAEFVDSLGAAKSIQSSYSYQIQILAFHAGTTLVRHPALLLKRVDA